MKRGAQFGLWSRAEDSMRGLVPQQVNNIVKYESSHSLFYYGCHYIWDTERQSAIFESLQQSKVIQWNGCLL